MYLTSIKYLLLFIATNNILHNTSYWWDIIYKYRFKDGVNLAKIREEQGYLKSFKYPFINNYIKENFGDKAWEPWSDVDRPLTPKELNTISTNSFVTLGNHTANHSILTNYSLQEIKEELSEANKALADITGKEPDTVAFPNGNFNTDVLDVTKELKFQFAFTTINKLNTLPFNNANLICLNRFMAKPASVKTYASLNRLGYNPDSLYASLKKGLIPQKKIKHTA